MAKGNSDSIGQNPIAGNRTHDCGKTMELCRLFLSHRGAGYQYTDNGSMILYKKNGIRINVTSTG